MPCSTSPDLKATASGAPAGGGEAFDLPIAVLPKPRDQIAGNADVKSAVWFAGKDVDARVAFKRHVWERVEKWTLKQVQGDE
jgi:hypothetical protein